MNAMVLYDSLYGNTERIARAIASGLEGGAEVKHVSQAKTAEVGRLEILIIGSPTQGGRATAGTKRFLGELGERALAGVCVASFDTRFASEEHGLPMRLLLRTVGYAAGRIAGQLETKGGKLLAPPEGFFVVGKEGPLRQGELERASAWGKALSGVHAQHQVAA